MASPEFELNGEGAPKGVIAAAAFWDVTRRTMSRWIAQGKKVGDPCPYRETGQFADWYQRVYQRPLPESVREKLESLQVKSPASVADEKSDLPDIDMSAFNAHDFTFDSQLLAMRQQFFAQQKLVEEARALGDRQVYQKESVALQKIADALRKQETASGKIRSQQGSVVSISEVRAAFAEGHQFIIARLKSELKTSLKPHLPGMAEKELEGLVNHAVETACASLAKMALLKSA